MPKAKTTDKTILLAEDHVIVRLALARYLRGCGFTVIEAAGASEAKVVLQQGPQIHVLFADAKLAGDEGGFGLAQWVRRYRSGVEVVLTGTLSHKADACIKLCERAPHEATGLLRDLQMRRRRSQTASVRPRAVKG